MAEGNENSNTLAELQTDKIKKLLRDQKFGNPYKFLYEECQAGLSRINDRISDIQKGNDEISGLLSAANATIDEYIDGLNQELDAINAGTSINDLIAEKHRAVQERYDLNSKSKISELENQIRMYQAMSSNPRFDKNNFRNIIANCKKQIDDIHNKDYLLSRYIKELDAQIERNGKAKKDLTAKLAKAENYRDSVQGEFNYLKDRLEKQQNQCDELSKLCAEFSFDPTSQSAFFNFLSRKCH